MAKFVREIGMLDIKELTEKEPEFALMTCCEFSSNLADLHFEDKSYPERFPIFQPSDKTEEHLCHGDFGIRNVLVDDNGNVVGIIDFAFATVGDNKYVDLARVISQSPPELESIYVEAFEKELGRMDKERLAKSVETWRYIDSQYINFMIKNQPEISLAGIV
jgi:thiamine kinase-like enzyme